MLAHPRHILLAIGGVDNDKEPISGLSIDDKVVDDAAILLAHLGVHRMTRAESRDVVGEKSLQARLGIVTIDVKAAHVRDVE